ncbi:DMT family transporter [[Eubacterium] cellulosolvens]
MNNSIIKSDAVLLFTSFVWGFAFVAQRVGMNHVGPFTFNGIRFALGSLALLPILILNQQHRLSAEDTYLMKVQTIKMKNVILGISLAGSVLFMGASLQQVGLIYTTAGKAGFITSLYVIIVPILGLLWRNRVEKGTWIGALLAVIGLYLLSVTEGFMIAFGDLLILAGAFFWASHILIIARIIPSIRPLKLAVFQYLICSILSIIIAFSTEHITLQGISQASMPILYGGFLSVGVGYTLQLIGQQSAPPAHAAILLSSEAVFAVFGGWLVLGENLSHRGLIGCVFIFSGMLFSQLWRGSLNLREECAIR